jgi:hypothetical protein
MREKPEVLRISDSSFDDNRVRASGLDLHHSLGCGEEKARA